MSGIATSGKTTVVGALARLLRTRQSPFRVIPEEETIAPIFAEDIDVAANLVYLNGLLSRAFDDACDVVVFERLLLTYAWMNGCSPKEFSPVIERLRDRACSIALLTVSESEISERLRRTAESRGSDWAQYIARKGGPTEIVTYYTQQQRDLLSMVTEIGLPFRLYPTTGKCLEDVADEVLLHHLEAECE